MTDHLTLGATPAGESCAQVGTPGYETIARDECRRFRALLIATFGEPPPGARFRITSNPHDFGTYYELAIYYDDANEAACDYAYRCESDAPEYWPCNEHDKPNYPIVEFHS